MPKQKSPMSNMESQGRRIVSNLQRAPKLSKSELARAIEHTLIEEAVNRVKAKQDTMPPKGDPIEWIEKNFYIPETRQPVQLAPYQQRALREALSLDDKGLFKYSTIIWSDIKKSGKTSVSAAVIDWLMSNMPYASAKIVANDLKQADSRAANMLRLNFKLHPREGVKVTPSGYKIEYPNNSVVESVPIDPAGEAGANDNIIAFDELWGAHEEAKERMFSEMTTSPTKFGKSFRMVSSYAGYSGESNLLWGLYLQGVSSDIHPDGQGLRFDWCNEFDPPLDCFYNPLTRMFCMWNTVPRQTWQIPEYYAAEAAILTDNEFRRIHRNQWVSPIEEFIPIQWWDDCYEDLPPLDSKQPMVLAMDAGVTSDFYAVVGVTHHPNRPKDRESVAVRYVRVWKPHGKKLDFDVIEDEITKQVIQARDKYNVKLVTYDSYQLAQMSSRLSKIVWTKVFSQAKDRWVADKQLRDMIQQRRIAHNGDKELRQALMNANAEISGEKLRIQKRSDSQKVDAAVALSMATASLVDPRRNFT